jgi:hypothetical protein
MAHVVGTPAHTAGIVPAVREWIDRHPEFRNNGRFYHAAMVGDHTAQFMGYTPESPEYIPIVEAEITRLMGEGHVRPERKPANG